MKREPKGVVVPMASGTYLRTDGALYFYGARALTRVQNSRGEGTQHIAVDIRASLRNTHHIKGCVRWGKRRVYGKVLVSEGVVWFETDPSLWRV